MLYPLSYEGEGGYCAICCAKLPLKPILCAGHRTTDPGFVRSGGACGPMGPVGRAGAAWGRLKGRPGADSRAGLGRSDQGCGYGDRLLCALSVRDSRRS